MAMITGVAAHSAHGQNAFSETIRTINATRAESPPVMDGKLDDACWTTAGVAEGFITHRTNLPAAQQSIGYICYDNRKLYIAMKCMMPKGLKPVGNLKPHDTYVFSDDTVEILIDPGKSGVNYCQLVVNAFGSTFDSWRGGGGSEYDPSWDGDWQDASSWQDAGSSWGEDAAWSEQAEPEPDIATVGSMGALDISTASSSSKKKTPWRSWYGGREWIRFNYDTGAAAVALPLEVAEGLPLKQVGSFVVASGAEIPNWGTVAMKALDEDGYPREIEGAVTEVHKPLAGGAALAKAHDAMVWDDGGVLIPKTTGAARPACAAKAARSAALAPAGE